MGLLFLDRVTLTSPTNLVSFDNIPQTGLDLVVKSSVQSSTYNNVVMKINGYDLSTGYKNKVLYLRNNPLDGAVADPSGPPVIYGTEVADANTFGNAETTIFNYASTYTKQTISEFAAANSSEGLSYSTVGISYNSYFPAGYFSSTAAVSRVDFATITGDFSTGSTFSLYITTED